MLFDKNNLKEIASLREGKLKQTYKEVYQSNDYVGAFISQIFSEVYPNNMEYNKPEYMNYLIIDLDKKINIYVLLFLNNTMMLY
ncbi:hypothetical protein AU379_23980 [Bacillus sp. JH7]|uniref:hypothetical protein n=1 Tax=Bacillus thuringiensis TaxID=1428 RepID=UPI000772D308|nr:hypothetical protein [Bacillus thuringiensis]KXH80348.1 hypothetical protein AU379_23980 [Bacillus sp. JH7]